MTAIATIGPLSRDVVAGAAPRPGGTVFYSTKALAHLGADARAAASCAAADRATLLTPLEAFGLPVAWYESTKTTAYTFHYEGDLRIMRLEAVGDPWSTERTLEAVGDAPWVYVGALTRTDFSAETLAELARPGRRLLVDAQGLVRHPQVGTLRIGGEIGDALRYVSILKLDEEEAHALAGTAEPHALRALGVSEVVLTKGSRGALVVTPQGDEHVPAPPVAGALDPTGAGDTFSAAYLHARSRDAEPVEAARTATATVAEFLRGSARGRTLRPNPRSG